MTIASEITRINNNIAAAYSACSNKGASLPNTQNSANLADCINSISTNAASEEYIILTNWFMEYSDLGTIPPVYEGNIVDHSKEISPFNCVIVSVPSLNSNKNVTVANFRLKKNTNYVIESGISVLNPINSSTDVITNYSKHNSSGGAGN